MEITFVKDARLPDSGDGPPHYTAGYCVDVSDAIAKDWIKSGHALAGKVEVKPAKPEPVKPVEAEKKEEAPVGKGDRRVRKTV